MKGTKRVEGELTGSSWTVAAEKSLISPLEGSVTVITDDRSDRLVPTAEVGDWGESDVATVPKTLHRGVGYERRKGREVFSCRDVDSPHDIPVERNDRRSDGTAIADRAPKHVQVIKKSLVVIRKVLLTVIA